MSLAGNRAMLVISQVLYGYSTRQYADLSQ
jgi:hypothetical protein